MRRSAVLLVLVVVTAAVAACSPQVSPPPAPARLAVTTIQTICGGAVPPPGTPFCRSQPASRTVAVSQGRTVVASGTSDADGQLTLDVPAGQLVVSVPGAQPYQNCDTPSVTAVAGATTPVTQTCTLLAP